MHFTLGVAETAPLGPHTFTLSSSLGAADFTLTVKPGLPPLVADPAPVVLAPGGDAIEILLTLGNPDEEDHRIDLAALADIMKTAGTKNVLDLRRIEAPLRTFGSMCIFCKKNTQRG